MQVRRRQARRLPQRGRRMLHQTQLAQVLPNPAAAPWTFRCKRRRLRHGSVSARCCKRSGRVGHASQAVESTSQWPRSANWPRGPESTLSLANPLRSYPGTSWRMTTRRWRASTAAGTSSPTVTSTSATATPWPASRRVPDAVPAGAAAVGSWHSRRVAGRRRAAERPAVAVSPAAARLRPAGSHRAPHPGARSPRQHGRRRRLGRA